MYRKLIAAATLVAMATSVMAADPCFPSPVSPKGDNNITQLVTIIWDDNAYSGKKGTTYETQQYISSGKWEDIGRVDGVMFSENTYNSSNPTWMTQDWSGTAIPNPGNYTEGDFGMSWAVQKLASGDKKFTFNPITGQMAPIYGPWAEKPTKDSRLGWKGYSYETLDWITEEGTWAPVCWGREYEVVVPVYQSGTTAKTLFDDPTQGVRDQPNWAQEMYQEAIDEGHEIGNHTIDHMESNSGLPEAEWPNGGDGFDNDLNEDEDNEYWEKCGWLVYAGRKIEKDTWLGAIKLGEAELEKYLKVNGTAMSVANNNLFSFRAPRLEVNSNLYLALQEAGYLYDCGLEENYEYHKDGTNALFPYTLDNGARNTWYQKDIGEKQTINEMPQAKDGDPLWQIPCNAYIVPEGIRDAVWSNHKKIVEAEIKFGSAVAADTMSKVEWIASGAKVTSFDFNMFVLWGMTKDQFVTTMDYNLQKRLDGNKAPLHFGAHTEYYSPMYDLGPLRTDSAYGACLEFNTWEQRIEALQQWVDNASGKGAKFVTGKAVIDSMKAWMASAPAAGTEHTIPNTVKWTFLSDAKSTSTKATFDGGASGDVTVTVAPTADLPWAKFETLFEKGKLKSLSNVSLDYNTNSALKFNIEMDDGKIYSALLNNIGLDVSSGMIPIHAFEDNAEGAGLGSAINTDNIVGLSIEALAPSNKDDGTYSERTDPYDVKFSVSNIKLYGNDVNLDASPITSNINVAGIKNQVMAISSNILGIKVADAGNYNVKVVASNGRTVKALDKASLKKGINKVSIDNLAKGMYVVKVRSLDNKVSFTHQIMTMK